MQITEDEGMGKEMMVEIAKIEGRAEQRNTTKCVKSVAEKWTCVWLMFDQRNW